MDQNDPQIVSRNFSTARRTAFLRALGISVGVFAVGIVGFALVSRSFSWWLFVSGYTAYCVVPVHALYMTSLLSKNGLIPA